MKPRVWVTGPVAEAALEPLREIAELDYRREVVRPSVAEMIARVPDVDALIPVSGAPVSEEVLSAARRLRIVANFGVGYDNVDVAACTRRGIPVTNTPGVLVEATADVAFGLLLAAARRFEEGRRAALEDRWLWAQGLMWGQEVAGAALGILGLGRIGQAVARRARGFGMRVLYTSRNRKPELERELPCAFLPYDELLAQCDFLSLHCALTAETRHILGPPQLARMKPTAVVVNTGRGGLVDQAALLDAVRAGRIAGAGLDVTDPEPPAPDDPILHDPRIVVTPHLGSCSVVARTGMTRLCVDNVLACLEGRPLLTCVNPEIASGGPGAALG